MSITLHTTKRQSAIHHLFLHTIDARRRDDDDDDEGEEEEEEEEGET